MTTDISHIYQGTQENAAKRARLKEILKKRSYRTGAPIKLASGRTSTFYFNTKPTMLDPEGANLIGNLILDALSTVEADFIGGLEMGAVPIASAIAPLSFIRGKPLRAFFIRKQLKDHGTQSLIEGLTEEENLRGKKIVVVEDVTTTGGSALKAAEAVSAEGGKIVQVITVIDRQEGATDIFRQSNLPFMALFGAEEFK